MDMTKLDILMLVGIVLTFTQCHKVSKKTKTVVIVLLQST